MRKNLRDNPGGVIPKPSPTQIGAVRQPTPRYALPCTTLQDTATRLALEHLLMIEMSTLTPAQLDSVAAFRDWLTEQLAVNERMGPAQTDDRDDGSTLTTRWPIGENLFMQVTLRPLIPQVRVGIVTDDRWKSEEIEQGVQDSGDTMEEFLELGFSDAGLDWDEPPVEHYREQGKWYSFITPVELASLDELAAQKLRDKVLRMINGYLISYGTL